MSGTDPPPNGPEDVGWSDADRGRAPLRYQIPPGATEKRCKSCRAPIYWTLTGSGKRIPINPDGIAHFATCADAKQHRRPS